MSPVAAPVMDPLAMAPKSSGSGASSGSLPQLPEWVAWLQVGLSALLAVLFLVMLSRARHQGARIQELQDRVQGLENTRALERTTGLEEQLRTTVERLQEVERATAQINVLSADNAALRAELSQLRRSAPPRPEQAPAAERPAAPTPPATPESMPPVPSPAAPLQPPPAP
jgi:TolA-binding protein